MQGNWLKGYTKRLGWCDAIKAELWGILLGLEMAWTDGYKNVIVENNAQYIVAQINKDSSELNNALGKRIRSFQARPWNLIFHFVNRETNRCAHCLASQGLSLSSHELRVLFSPWLELQSMIFGGAIGASHAPNSLY